MPWNTHRITSETTREFRNPLLGLFMAWKKINTLMYWHSKSIIHVDAVPVSAWANLVGRWKAATGSMFVLSGLQPTGVFERVSIHGTRSPQACIFLFMSGWPNWCQLSRSLGAVHNLKTFILLMWMSVAKVGGGGRPKGISWPRKEIQMSGKTLVERWRC